MDTRDLFLVPPNSVYLCGNSLGLQPKLTQTRIREHLETWAALAVSAHVTPAKDSALPVWLNVDSAASAALAPLLGARPAEVAVMDTLTTNLHLLLAAFYRPERTGRHKILLERAAFPSDHYAAESQVRHHGLSPETSLITIASTSSETLTTAEILAFIAQHATTAAVLLFPGVQYFTGQLMDIPTITTAARRAGIFVIWDLAHAVGNVPVQLHDWDVDAAVWCSYKYLNAGPGAVAGMFVHDRHTRVEPATATSLGYTNRFSGWWGNDKATRFQMRTDQSFVPAPGAAGFQLSNPSVLSITSLTASLEVFALAGGISVLRDKSRTLTGHLDTLLRRLPAHTRDFSIITPSHPDERGAQISLRLRDDRRLDAIMAYLGTHGVIVDQRRPSVIRVSPAPLYNTLEDVETFVRVFGEALRGEEVDEAPALDQTS